METQSYTVVDVHNICMGCLTETNELLNIFDLETLDEGIGKLFSSFSGYQLDSFDGTCNLCNPCVNRLRDSFNFYQTCQRSANIFFKYLEMKPDESDYLPFENFAKVIKNQNAAVASAPLRDETDESEMMHDIDGFEYADHDYFTPDPKHEGTKKDQNLLKLTFEQIEQAIKTINAVEYEDKTCIKCNYTFIDTLTLFKHMKDSHSEMELTWCIVCNKEYVDMDLHNTSHNSDLIKCNFCKKSRYFVSKADFINHLVKHAPVTDSIHSMPIKANELFRCEYCSGMFFQNSDLQKHMEKHELQLHCAMCKKLFNSEEEQNNHECNVEKKKCKNYCTQCNRKVKSLSLHVQSFHNEESADISKAQTTSKASILCNVCGKQFKSASKLTVHMRTHTNECPYTCSYCNKSMKTKSTLVIHLRTHTGEKPYSCNICGKTFSQTNIRNTHMRLHTGKTDECKVCGLKLARPGFLKLHMRSHTGEKPYLCNVCGHRFAQRSHLTAHLRVHTDERPYSCTYCEKRFKLSTTLRKHVLIHTGSKPYKCTVCPYACRQQFSLKQHMKQHNNDPNFTIETADANIHNLEQI